ncbi:YbhB/YbcL family Raf kinase inhibitor-like protein [Kaarinaea lacus]
MTLSLTSPVFQNNEAIPVRFTCNGEDISPPLHWSGVPKNAKSLVLIVDDPDAPDPAAPKMTWVHWVMYNIPPYSDGLQEDLQPARIPEGAEQGTNDWNCIGYGGPCPPTGRHRYVHKLYALDDVLPNLGKASKTDVEKAMQGHIIEQTELVGTFQK